MAMPTKGKSKYSPSVPSPSVVSTNCSSLKSFYRSCRSHFSCSEPSSNRYLPINPTSRKPTSSATEVYWERACQLRNELKKLDELLNMEKNLGDSVNNLSGITNPVKIASKEVNFGTCGKFSERKEVLKLGDGGYLHEISENLAMQVSEPALIPVENGSNFSQVIKRMASMGRHNLFNWLFKSIPMCDLSRTGTGIASSVIPTPRTEEGFLEAILIEGVEKLETLALEGLKTQTIVTEKAQTIAVDYEVGDGLMEVMLIQMVDPAKSYIAVGEMMIGFIEASFGERTEGGFQLRGIHVAGTCRERNEHGYLWSVSMRNIGKGSCISCSYEIVKNPNVTLSS